VKNRRPILIVLLVAAAITLSFYHQAILAPDRYLFSDQGDGMKNYFTYAWHVKHDTSCTDFQGMNYPYGEHVLYSDCHPLLSGVLRQLSGLSDIFPLHSIGFLNFLMVSGIFLTILVCYKLLREFSVEWKTALQLSIGMALLAPQVFRMTGHFALSYSFAIPLSWLLLLRAMRSERAWLHALILLLNGLFWTFIHAYMGVIIMAFQFLILVTHKLQERNVRGLFRHFLLLSSIILPALIFLLALQLTDAHTGRTGNPSGFFLYNAEPDDILLPHQGLFREFLDRVTGNGIKQEWEARSYIGVATAVILLIAFVSTITGLIRRKTLKQESVFATGKLFQASLIAALFLLLFALAIPFRQFPALVDYFPVFKQFRATGRFAWPFFFVALVYSAIVLQNLHNKFRTGRHKLIPVLLILSVAALNFLEGLPYHVEISRSITQAPNLFRKDLLPEDLASSVDSIQPEQYQAIISLPFYYYGSEAYSRPRHDDAKRNSMVIAYHTGIPLVNADLTRTSVGESRKVVQIVSPDFYPKEIRDDISDPRPFLVVRTGSTLTENELGILRKASLVSERGPIGLYSLSPEALFRSSGPEIISKFENEMESLKPGMESLIKNPSFLLTDPASLLIFKDFEDAPSPVCFDGKGAYSGQKKGRNVLAEFKAGTFTSDKLYSLSVWMHNAEPDALNLWFRLIVEEYDEGNGQWHSTVFFPEEAETIRGDWSLVEGTFRVMDPKNQVFIVTKGSQDSKASLHADDLLIRENGTDVYRWLPGTGILFKNNQRSSGK
jgi:hypothetical protein